MRFYLDLKIIGENQDSLDCVVNDKFFDYIYTEYLQYFSLWREEIEEIKRKKEEKALNFYDFKEIFKMGQEQIMEFYKEYKNTKSFMFIKKNLEENDQINSKLYSYNIISKDEE